MLVNGIIAEYNPFHNGHKYHMEISKLRTGADYTVVVMSGDFTQRGAPAIFNKYVRTQMALECGADLVLELPVFFASGSAEYFAEGAISLLDKLGVVDYLCFGAESGDGEVLSQVADVLLKEPPEFKQQLQAYLREGKSYPAARAGALYRYCISHSLFLKDDVKDMFTAPNNILGIEYLKALKRRESSIKPMVIQRMGSDYHARSFGTGQSSALALRHAIWTHQSSDALQTQMPEAAWEILRNTLASSRPVNSNDFSAQLLYRLLLLEETGYTAFTDVSPDLSDRIQKQLYAYTNVNQFCDLCKSKNVTHARISRCLTHILLDIRTEEFQYFAARDYTPYGRILGLRRQAAPLLSAIKEHASVPLISKLADADRLLSPDAGKLLKKDVLASHVYAAAETGKARTCMRNEYSTPIVVID